MGLCFKRPGLGWVGRVVPLLACTGLLVGLGWVGYADLDILAWWSLMVDSHGGVAWWGWVPHRPRFLPLPSMCVYMQVVDPQLPSNADWREAGYRFLLQDEEGAGGEGEEGSRRKPRRSGVGASEYVLSVRAGLSAGHM